jgi:hypothetical protein
MYLPVRDDNSATVLKNVAWSWESVQKVPVTPAAIGVVAACNGF